MTMPEKRPIEADPTLAALEHLADEFRAFRVEMEALKPAKPDGVVIPNWLMAGIVTLAVAVALALGSIVFDVKDIMATRYTRDDANADSRRNESVHNAYGLRLQRLEQIHDLPPGGD